MFSPDLEKIFHNSEHFKKKQKKKTENHLVQDLVNYIVVIPPHTQHDYSSLKLHL